MTVIAEFMFALGFEKADTAELDKAERAATGSAKNVDAQWKKTKRSIATTSAAIVGAAAGAAAGLFKFAEAAAEAANVTAKTARQYGYAAGELQRLQFATERATLATGQDLVRSLNAMTLGLQNAAQKGTGPVADGLAAVGLAVSDLAGLGVEAQFGAIADAIGRLPNETDRAGVAMQIFGARGGSALKPLLDEGSAGIRKLGDEAERLGLVLGEESLAASEEFVDAMSDTRKVIGSFARDIGLEAMPAVRDAVDGFREWALANRELIGTKIREFVGALTHALQQTAAPLLELLPLAAKLAGTAAELATALGPAGATGALAGLRLGMAGALGPAGLLATAIATIASALIQVAVNAQNARFALDDVLQGGRGKRGEGTRRLVSKREGQLQAQKRALADRAEALRGPNAARAALGDGESFPTDQRGVIALSNRAKRLRSEALQRSAELDKEITAERKRAASESAESERLADVFVGPSPDAATPGKPKKPAGGRSGRKGPDEFDAQAEALFGEEVRGLAGKSGVGEVAIASSISAAADSLRSGAAEGVARKSARSRLGGLAGKDFGSKPENDPLLSAIFGEDVPDVELSSLALGAQPQTLVANITNNFEFDIDQEINGSGDPESVGQSIAGKIRETFEGALEKSTRTAKVNFAR